MSEHYCPSCLDHRVSPPFYCQECSVEMLPLPNGGMDFLHDLDNQLKTLETMQNLLSSAGSLSQTPNTKRQRLREFYESFNILVIELSGIRLYSKDDFPPGLHEAITQTLECFEKLRSSLPELLDLDLTLPPTSCICPNCSTNLDDGEKSLPGLTITCPSCGTKTLKGAL